MKYTLLEKQGSVAIYEAEGKHPLSRKDFYGFVVHTSNRKNPPKYNSFQWPNKTAWCFRALNKKDSMAKRGAMHFFEKQIGNTKKLIY